MAFINGVEILFSVKIDNSGATNDTEWCGEYIEGAAYKKGAIVSYNGDIYLCIKDCDDAQDTTYEDYWEKLNTNSGGGSAPIIVPLTGYNNTGENMTVHYLAYENNAFVYKSDIITPTEHEKTFNCVDQSIVYIATKSGYCGDYVGGKLSYVRGGDNYCAIYMDDACSEQEATFDFS